MTTSARRVRTVHSPPDLPTQVAERIRQAALDPVSDHHAGAERGIGEELLRHRQRRTHPFIRRTRRHVTPG